MGYGNNRGGKQEFDNNLTGVLYENGKKDPDKKADEKLPDRTGHCEIDGVEYYLSGWINVSGKGVRYLKLAFKKKEDKNGGNQGGGGQSRDQGRGNADNNNRSGDGGDVPF